MDWTVAERNNFLSISHEQASFLLQETFVPSNCRKTSCMRDRNAETARLLDGFRAPERYLDNESLPISSLRDASDWLSHLLTMRRNLATSRVSQIVMRYPLARVAKSNKS
jgi:hypothetical protein